MKSRKTTTRKSITSMTTVAVSMVFQPLVVLLCEACVKAEVEANASLTAASLATEKKLKAASLKEASDVLAKLEEQQESMVKALTAASYEEGKAEGERCWSDKLEAVVQEAEVTMGDGG
jgi:hypothetical protein